MRNIPVSKSRYPNFLIPLLLFSIFYFLSSIFCSPAFADQFSGGSGAGADYSESTNAVALSTLTGVQTVTSVIRAGQYISAITRTTSSVVTVTLTADYPSAAGGAYNLKVGQNIVIYGVPGFNGTFPIASVTSSTTFTYAQTGTAGVSGVIDTITASPLVTSGVAGGHYTTLTTWEADRQGNITAAGRNTIEAAECYNDWSSGMDDHLTVLGWTFNSTHYVKVYTPISERHIGVAGTGFCLSPTTAGNAISLDPYYIQVIGLEIKATGSGRYIYMGNGWYCTIANCLIYGGYSGTGIADGANMYNTFYNNIIYGCTTGIYAWETVVGKVYNNIIYNCTTGINGNGQNYIYDNTVYNCGTGINGTAGGTYYLKNNLCIGNTTDYSGTFDTSSTNNISSDSTAPPYNTYYTGKTSAEMRFLSSATSNVDLHIQSASTNLNLADSFAIGKGADLTSDANCPITTDIDGHTRNTGANQWDIGADQSAKEFVCAIRAAGTTNPAPDYSLISAWVTAMNGKDFTRNATRVFSGTKTGTIADGDAVTGATSGVTGICVHAGASQILINEARKALSGASIIFTKNSSTVTGGTAFTTEVKPGDWIRTNTVQLWAQVFSVESNSSLTLCVPYTGADVTGLAVIAKGFQANEQIRKDTSNYLTTSNDAAGAGATALAVAECYNDWPSGLNNTAGLEYGSSYLTTDPQHKVIVRTPLSQRHNGTAHSGFYLKPTTQFSIYSSASARNMRIEGIEVDESACTVDYGVGLGWYSAIHCENIEILNCMVYNKTGIGYGIKIAGDATSKNIKIYDNFVYTCATRGIDIQGNIAGNAYLYNNSVYNCAVGIITDANAKVLAKNNIALTGGFSGTFASGSDYNAYSNGSSGGTHDVSTTATDNFVSTTDLHLKTNAPCVGASALNLTSDVYLNFTTDIDNNSRPATGNWAIGAHNYSPATWKTNAATTEWNTGSNWNIEAVPNSSHDVVIPAGCSNYPSLTASPAAIKTLTCPGTLTLNSWTVTVGGGVDFTGGTLNKGTGTIKITGGGLIKPDGKAFPTLDIEGGTAGAPVILNANLTCDAVKVGETASAYLSFTQGTAAALTVSGALTVYANGTITCPYTDADGTPTDGIGRIITAASIDIQTGGKIYADGLGFAGGQGANGSGPGGGITASGNRYGGGGYGGAGGAGGTLLGGVPYGSATGPVALGSGGGGNSSTWYGGNGGGAIKLSVTGTLTVNGTLSANGSDAAQIANTYCGGGSGGSVWVTGGATLKGTGTINVAGGKAGTYGNAWNGGGGGGRIDLSGVTVAGSTFFTGGGTISVIGGLGTGSHHQSGVAGTIKFPANFNLVIDNSGAVGLKNLTLGLNYENSAVDETFYNFNSVTVKGDSTLTLSGATQIPNGGSSSAPWGQGVTINSASINVEATGKISAAGKGFAGNDTNGTYPLVCGPGQGFFVSGGSPSGYRASGGGYGGAGGDATYGDTTATGGSAYASTAYTTPTALGSGGGVQSAPTSETSMGGGGIKLSVSGTLTVAGTISANGIRTQSTYGQGGGSGGSVYLSVGTLAGAGTITANGASGYGSLTSYPGGGGGGGRVAVYYNTSYSITPIATAGAAGTYSSPGAVGTVYIQGQGAGTFTWVGNAATGSKSDWHNYLNWSGNAVPGPNAAVSIPSSGVTTEPTISTADATIASLTVATGRVLTLSGKNITVTGNVDCDGAMDITNRTLTVGGNLDLTNGTLTEAGSTIIMNSSDAAALTSHGEALNILDIEGAGPHSLADSASVTTLKVGETATGVLSFTQGNTATLTATDITVYATGTITCPYTSTSLPDTGGSGRTITAANIDIQTGGTLNADGLGFGAGAGPGLNNLTATYGGRGASNTAATYGSATNPTSLGSGGNNNSGGGAIILSVTGTLTVNGTLSSNGSAINNGYQGGGGSINITCATFAGAGTIQANAGIGSNYNGSGGGRVSLLNAGTITFSGTLQANGGNSQVRGNAGTIVFPQNYSLTVGTGGIASPLALGTDDSYNYDFGTGTITVANGATLYIDGNPNLDDHSGVKWGKAATISAANINIATGGKISVDSLGFFKGYGPGNDGVNAHGGTYGGLGGGSTVSTYGSQTNPINLGSGSPIRSGGGAVILSTSGTLTVAGTISANGEGGSYGGGSGGSVYLACNKLTGSGTITAGGGNSSAPGNGGGGGRCALYYTTSYSIPPTALGGTGGSPAGAAGTVYIQGGATAQWTGTQSTDWADYRNWQGNAVPGTATAVTIPDVTNDPIIAAGSTPTIGSLTINTGGKLSLATSGSTNLTVTGNITNSGTLEPNNNTITCGGNFDTSAGTFTYATSTLIMNGSSGTKTLTLDSAKNVNNLTFNGAATFALATNVNVYGNWTVTAGTISAGTTTVKFIAGGNSLNITGSHTLKNVEFNFTAYGSYTIAAGTTLTVSGTLTISGYGYPTINTGAINAKGDIIITNTNTNIPGNATININGTGTQTLTGGSVAGQGSLPNVFIDKSGTTLNLVNTITVYGDWTLNAGTINAGTSTVQFMNANKSITGSQTLYNVNFCNPNAYYSFTITAGTTLTVAGTLTLSGTGFDTINTGTINAQGDITITNTSSTNGGTATININGTGAQALTGPATIGQGALPNVTLNKSTGALTTSGKLTFAGAGTVTAGTLPLVDDTTFQNDVTIASGATLSCTTGGKTITFTGGKTYTVNSGGQFTMRGASGAGNLLTLARGGTGTWAFNMAGIYDINYVDVYYSNAAGGSAIYATNSTDNAGVAATCTNWNFNTSAVSWNGSASIDWHTAANWTPAIVPGSGYAVTIPTLSVTNNPTLGSATTIGSLTMETGRTLTCNTNLTVTGDISSAGTMKLNATTLTGAGNINFAGGALTEDTSTIVMNAASGTKTLTLPTGDTVVYNITFSGAGEFGFGNANVTVTGVWSQSAGTVNAPSGTLTLKGNYTHSAGTFTHNNGTVAFTDTLNDQTIDVSTTETFYNLTTNKPAKNLIISSGDTAVVSGQLTLTDGSINTGTIDAKGAISVASTFDGGTGLLIIDGTGNQSFVVPDGATLPSITVNSVNTTISFATGASATISGAFTLQAGAFTAPNGTLTAAGGFTHTAGGTFTNNNGTVSFTGSAATIDVATSETFNNLTINKTTAQTLTIAAGDTLVVNGALTLTDGAVGTGTLEAKAAVSVGAGFDGGNAALTLSGTADQAITLTTGGVSPTGVITVNKSAGTATTSGVWTFSQVVTIQAGALSLGDNTTFSNTVTVNSGGVLSCTTGGKTITFTGGNTYTVNSGGQFTMKGASLNLLTLTRSGASNWNLLMNGGYDVDYATVGYSTSAGSGSPINATNSSDAAAPGSSCVNWIFNNTSFTWNGSSSTDWYTAANWTPNGLPSSATDVIIPDTTSIYKPALGSATTIKSLIINTGGQLTLGANLTTTGDITNSGTLLPQTKTIYCGGNFNTTAGTFTYATSTLAMNAASEAKTITLGAQQLYNLTFSGAGAFSFADANVTVNGAWTQSVGTVTAPSGTLTVTGGFTHTAGGTWTHNSGTVAFTGSAATVDVATTETFNGLTINKTTANTLTIATGDTLVVNGTLTLTDGAVGTGTLDAKAAVSAGAGFDGGNATLNITGAAAQAITLTSGCVLPSAVLTVNKSAGTATVAGTATFPNDVTVSGGTLTFNGGTYTFTAAKTLAVSLGATLNFAGVGGNPVTLRSSSTTGSPWYLTKTGTVSADWVDVKDSNASATITATNSVDSGGNTNWSILNLSNWDLDMQAGTLTMDFSAIVNASSLNANQNVVIQNATGTSSCILTGGTTSSVNGTTIVMNLLAADLNAIKANANIAKQINKSDSYLTNTTSLISGTGGAPVNATTTRKQVRNYTPDSTAPTFSSWILNMNTQTLELTFNEPVSIGTFDKAKFTLQNNSSGTYTYPLAGSYSSGVYDALTAGQYGVGGTSNVKLQIRLTVGDFNNLADNANIAKAEASSYLVIAAASGIQDMAATPNALAAVAATQVATGGYTASTAAPTNFKITTSGGASSVIMQVGNAQALTIKAYDAVGYRCTSYAGTGASAKTLVFTGASNSPRGNIYPTARNYLSVDVNFGDATKIEFTNGIGSTTLTPYCKESNVLIKASDTVSVPNVATAHADALTLTTNPLTKFELFFSVQPSPTCQLNTLLAQQPTVVIRDVYGNQTADTDTIKLWASSTDSPVFTGTAPAVLSATTNPLAATSGEAAFGGVKYDTKGTIYLYAEDTTAPSVNVVWSSGITFDPAGTSTVEAPTTQVGTNNAFNLIPTYDTLGEKFPALKFQVKDAGLDGTSTRIDQIKIKLGGTGGAPSTDIAWAELRGAYVSGDGLSYGADHQISGTGTISQIEGTYYIVFGSTPNGDSTAQLDSVPDNTIVEYTVNIYMKATQLTATDGQTYTFTTNETLVSADTGQSSQMVPESTGKITTPITGTITVTLSYFQIVEQAGGTATVSGTARQGIKIILRATDANKNIDKDYAGNKTLIFSGLNAAPVSSYKPSITYSINTINFGSNTSINFPASPGGVTAADAVTLTAYKAETRDVSVKDIAFEPNPLTVFTLQATIAAANANKIELTSGNSQVGKTVKALPSPFVTTVSDLYGNPKSGVAVTFAIASPSGQGSLSGTQPISTDPLGQASSTLTFGTTEGAYSITATSGTLTGSPASFSATGRTPRGIYIVSGDTQSKTINLQLDSSFFFKLVDAASGDGNYIPNETINFSVPTAPATAPTGATTQTLSASSGTTNSSGQVSTRLTLGQVTGDYTTTATYAGVTPNLTKGITATATSAGATKIVFTDPPSSVTAGSASAAFTITTKDIFNNIIPLTTATDFNLTTTPGSFGVFYGSLANAQAGTNPITQVNIASGSSSAQFWYKHTATGTFTVTAAKATGGQSLPDGSSSTTPTITIVPATLSYFEVTASGSHTANATAGAPTPTTITVTAYDALNNPVTNLGTTNVKFKFADGAAHTSAGGTAPTCGGAAFGNPVSLTFSGTTGAVTTSLILYKPETSATAIIKAYTDSGADTTTGNALALTVQHAAADHTKFSGPLPSSPTAGGEFSFGSVTLDVVDLYGNICNGANGATAYTETAVPVTLTLSGTVNGPSTGTDKFLSSVNLTANVNFSAGQSPTGTPLTATLHYAQNTTITPTIAALPGSSSTPVRNEASNPITVGAGTVSQLWFSQTPTTTGTTNVALTPNQPAVSVSDTYGNAATNASGSITLSAVDTSYGAGINGVLGPTANLTVNLSSGVAAFTGIKYSYPESIRLKAMASDYTSYLLYSAPITLSAANELTITSPAEDSGYTSVSSIANAVASKVNVYAFKITDAGIDGLGGVIKKIVINQSAGDTARNWSSYINDAYLTDNASTPTSVLGTVAYNSLTDKSTITFGDGTGTIFTTPNTSSRTYTLSITMKSALPAGADGKVLGFSCDANDDITLASVSSAFPASAAITNNVAVAVAASKLVITGTSAMGAGDGQTITVTAKDANNNIDKDYAQDSAGSKTLTFTGASTSTSGDIPTCTNSGGSAKRFVLDGTALTFTAGAATSTMTLYKAELAYIVAIDTGNLTAAGSDRLSVNVTGGAAAKLYWETPGVQPAAYAVAGAPWKQFVVKVGDNYGNTATSSVTVTITPSAGTASGNTAAVSGGLATFNNFKLATDTALTGVTLTAGGTNLTNSAASNEVRVDLSYGVIINIKDATTATPLQAVAYSVVRKSTNTTVASGSGASPLKSSDVIIAGGTADTNLALTYGADGIYTITLTKDKYVDYSIEVTADSSTDGVDGTYDNKITWTFNVTSIEEATADYNVKSSFVYDEENLALEIRLWLERRGKLVINTDLNKLGAATVDVFDNATNTWYNQVTLTGPGSTDLTSGTFIRTITSATSASNAFGIALTAGRTYFAKCRIKYGGTTEAGKTTYEGGTTFTVTITQKLSNDIIDKMGLGSSGITLVERIAAVTSALTSRLATTESTVGSKITTSQAALESAVSTSETAVKAKVAEVLTEAQTTIPAAITTAKTAMIDVAKSEILNSENSIRTGQTMTVRFRTYTGLSPTIDVYDADNTHRISAGAMKEIGATGVYEYDVKFLTGWGRGDFTIVCKESTKSTMDAMNISVLRTDIEQVAGQVAAVVGTTSSISNLTSVAAQLDSQFSVIESALSKVGKDMMKEVKEAVSSAMELEAVFSQLSNVAKQIKSLSGDSGIDLSKLYNVSVEKQHDITYLKNKSQELKATMEVNQKLIENVTNKPVTQTWYEYK